MGHRASKYHNSTEEEGRASIQEYIDSIPTDNEGETREAEQQLMSPGTVGAIEKGVNQISSEALLMTKDQMTFDNDPVSFKDMPSYKYYHKFRQQNIQESIQRKNIENQKLADSSRSNDDNDDDLHRPSTIQEASISIMEETECHKSSVARAGKSDFESRNRSNRDTIKAESPLKKGEISINDSVKKHQSLTTLDAQRDHNQSTSKQLGFNGDQIVSGTQKLTTMSSVDGPKKSGRSSQVPHQQSMEFGQNILINDSSQYQIFNNKHTISSSQDLNLNNVNAFSSSKELEKAPFIKNYPNLQYKDNDSIRLSHHDPLSKIEVPDQNLMAICIIQNEHMRGQSQNEFLQPALRSRSIDKNSGRSSAAYRFDSKKNSARSSSVNNRRGAFNCDRSLNSGRSNGSRRFGATDLSVDTQDISLGGQALFGKAKDFSDDQQFFTTSCEVSDIVFKSLNHEKVHRKVVKSLLRKCEDCKSFLTGVFQDEQLSGPNLRLYNFDKCLSDRQHTRAQHSQTQKFLRAWLMHSKIQDQQPLTQKPLRFCFLFGSAETQKSESLNLMNKNSLLQEFLRDYKQPIQNLRISMFFQDQEFVLNNRKFDSKKQSRREIGMEIREALRDKNRLVSKLTKQQPSLSVYIQKCSHFRIQLNNFVFIDMADLRGLQYHENPEVVQTLTNDFGSMTNEILRQSQFYENHEFQINEDQANSAFNEFLSTNITKQSKILLLTFVNNDPADETSSSIALDFSHKIRQYFSGNSDECGIQSILRMPCEIDPGALHQACQKLGIIFSKLTKMKTRVNRELYKAERQQNFIVSAQNLKGQAQNHLRFLKLFEHFREFIAEATHEDFPQVFEPEHLAHIDRQICSELDAIHGAIGSLGRYIDQKSPYGQMPLAEAKMEIRVMPRGRSRQASGSRQASKTKPKVTKPVQKVEAPQSSMIPRQSRLNTSSSNTTLGGSKIAERGPQPFTHKRNNQTVTISDCEARPQSSLSSKQATKVFQKKSTGFQQQSRTSSRLSYGARADQKGSKSRHNRSISQQKSRSKSKSKTKQVVTTKKARVASPPNGDLPLNNREKLSQEIETQLSVLRQKKQTVNLDLNKNQVLEYKSRGPSEGTFDNNLKQSGLTPDGSRSGLEILAQSHGNVESIIQSARDEAINPDYQLQIRNFENIYKMQEDQSQNYQVENIRVSASQRDSVSLTKQPRKDRSKSKKQKTRKSMKGSSNHQQSLVTNSDIAYRDASPEFDLPEKQGKQMSNPFKESVITQVTNTEAASTPGYHRRNTDQASPILLQENTAQRNQIHEIKSLQSEVQRLKQQLQFQQEEYQTNLAMMELEFKNQQTQMQDIQKRYSEKRHDVSKEELEDLRDRCKELQQEKQQSDELNSSIMKQVQLMKEAIRDSQEREELNIQLMEKNNSKNQKINELKSDKERLLDQLKTKDQYIIKLKERVEVLERSQKDASQDESNEKEEIKSKYKALKTKYKQEQEKVSKLEDEIERVDAAKERFRNQTLDQKQEIRRLKEKLNEENRDPNRDIEESKSSTQRSYSEKEERPFRKPTPKEADKKMDSLKHNIKEGLESFRTTTLETVKSTQEMSSINKPSRKNDVIKDIKSLIKDYKKDLKPLEQSTKSRGAAADAYGNDEDDEASMSTLENACDN